MRYFMFQKFRNSINLPVALPLNANGLAQVACPDPTIKAFVSAIFIKFLFFTK